MVKVRNVYKGSQRHSALIKKKRKFLCMKNFELGFGDLRFDRALYITRQCRLILINIQLYLHFKIL